MTQLSWQRAVPDDGPEVVQMMRELAVQDGYEFDPETGTAAARQLSENDQFGALLVLRESPGARAGYLAVTFGFSLEYGGRDAFVDELFVREPYRGRGLGTAGLRSANDLCRAAGIRALHLEVDLKNTRARALYESLGYIVHERALMTLRLDESHGRET